jgi:hypothetical protein
VPVVEAEQPRQGVQRHRLRQVLRHEAFRLALSDRASCFACAAGSKESTYSRFDIVDVSDRETSWEQMVLPVRRCSMNDWTQPAASH